MFQNGDLFELTYLHHFDRDILFNFWTKMFCMLFASAIHFRLYLPTTTVSATNIMKMVYLKALNSWENCMFKVTLSTTDDDAFDILSKLTQMQNLLVTSLSSFFFFFFVSWNRLSAFLSNYWRTIRRKKLSPSLNLFILGMPQFKLLQSKH